MTWNELTDDWTDYRKVWEEISKIRARIRWLKAHPAPPTQYAPSPSPAEIEKLEAKEKELLKKVQK